MSQAGKLAAAREASAREAKRVVIAQRGRLMLLDDHEVITLRVDDRCAEAAQRAPAVAIGRIARHTDEGIDCMARSFVRFSC
jgi:hypothetical protein